MSPHIRNIFIPVHVMGIIALLFIPFVSWYWLLLSLLGWILFSGCGIAVGFHRLFCHKSFETSRFFEIFLLICGVFGAEGSSIFWKSTHNGSHHPHSDTVKDFHSPIHGKWHAFFTWVFKVKPDTFNFRYSVDLMRDPAHLHVHKHYNKYFWIPILAAFIINWHIGLFLFGLPMLISIYQENFVNLFCHTKTMFGYRNFETRDKSMNHWILGYLTWGNGWHNNHHAEPREYDFGLGRKHHWWEFDPCILIINLIKKR